MCVVSLTYYVGFLESEPDEEQVDCFQFKMAEQFIKAEPFINHHSLLYIVSFLLTYLRYKPHVIIILICA